MILAVEHYDEKNKRIILSYNTKEYIDKKMLDAQGLHFAKSGNEWALAIYVNPVTQTRLNKTKEFIEHKHWQLAISDSIFIELGHHEFIDRTFDEKLNLIFQESTYNNCNPIFARYTNSYVEPNWFNWMDQENRREIISKISNQLHFVADNEQDSIVYNALNFDVGNFIKNFIDEECEIARRYHEYAGTINHLYFYYGKKFVNWLDAMARRHYIKVLMKKRKHTTLSPTTLSTEQVLNYLYTEIPVIKNEAMVAMIRLLNEKDMSPIERANVYQSIIDGSFKSRKKSERALFSQFASAEKKDRYEVEYLLSPLIFK